MWLNTKTNMWEVAEPLMTRRCCICLKARKRVEMKRVPKQLETRNAWAAVIGPHFLEYCNRQVEPHFCKNHLKRAEDGTVIKNELRDDKFHRFDSVAISNTIVLDKNNLQVFLDHDFGDVLIHKIEKIYDKDVEQDAVNLEFKFRDYESVFSSDKIVLNEHNIQVYMDHDYGDVLVHKMKKLEGDRNKQGGQIEKNPIFEEDLENDY